MYDWAQIPTDIFFTICDRLAYKDIIVASSICKPWKLSGCLFLGGIQFPSKVPWLMLAEEDKRGLSSSVSVRNFFDLSSDIHLQMNLFHPLTGRMIDLPHYSTFEKYDPDDDPDEPEDILILKAFASADPWNSKVQDYNRDCIIMVTYDLGLPAFVRLGGKTWTDVQTESQYYGDVVCYKGQFLFLSSSHLYACNLDGDQASSTNIIAHNPKHLIISTQKYLVELEGELLVVFRHFGGGLYSKSSYSANISKEIPYLTTSFDVLKLIKTNGRSDEHEFEFVGVESLGDQALFVGFNASFSLSATNLNGCCGNSIYFTDDSWEMYSETKNGGGYDMGIYNLSDGTVKQHYEGESLSYFSTPIWYI
ncbi:hypothetical protein ACFE04_016807 [Oxalis oulophora]